MKEKQPLPEKERRCLQNKKDENTNMPFLDNRQSAITQAKLIHSIGILPVASGITQLKISYNSGRFKSKEELAAALHELYDESLHEVIDGLIDIYEDSKSRAIFGSEVFNFIIENLKECDCFPNYKMVTVPSSSTHGPMLPDKVRRDAETDAGKALTTFNFSSVTLGRLTLMKGKDRISFQDRQVDAQFHAEDGLIEQMTEFLENKKIDTTLIKVNLTINNFFCSHSSTKKHKRSSNCLDEIIALQDKYGFARFHVYFQNTYGDSNNMTKLIKLLQQHGILVTAFTTTSSPPYTNEFLDPESESENESLQQEEEVMEEEQDAESSMDEIQVMHGMEEEQSAESSMDEIQVMHQSVLSEADRIGISEIYEIGFADGTDRNCSIISIFTAAGVKINREDAMRYREALGIDPGINIDLTREVATKILNLVTENTHQKYRLYVIYEIPDSKYNVEEYVTNGGEVPIFIFFAGAHFSPAWHK